jgi:hypothetical protein
LKRVNSLPAHLPSNPPRQTEVKPVRKPISRPKPDARPPATFQSNGRLVEGSIRKIQAMKRNVTDRYGHFEHLIQNDEEYKAILKSKHPNFDFYSPAMKDLAFGVLLDHPRFQADFAHARNLASAIPTGPTATRTMEPLEQKFLTQAFRQLNEQIGKNPFRMHGETLFVGNREGDVTRSTYSPKGQVEDRFSKPDKFQLHNHPPFGGPFDSSASQADHRVAAELYRDGNLKMNSYLTNGKDALHIRPDSTELVKLIPDPRLEEQLGKFPVAFELPKPENPPQPFSNHEAPAGFKAWVPPEGWVPPKKP